MSHVIIFFILLYLQCGEASRGRVFCQRGLPCLFYYNLLYYNIFYVIKLYYTNIIEYYTILYYITLQYILFKRKIYIYSIICCAITISLLRAVLLPCLVML